MEPTEQEAEAQEAPEAEAPHAAQDAAPPEPKRRGRPPGSKNKPKQDVPTEPAAPKRKPKPPLETALGASRPCWLLFLLLTFSGCFSSFGGSRS